MSYGADSFFYIYKKNEFVLNSKIYICKEIIIMNVYFDTSVKMILHWRLIELFY